MKRKNIPTEKRSKGKAQKQEVRENTKKNLNHLGRVESCYLHPTHKGAWPLPSSSPGPEREGRQCPLLMTYIKLVMIILLLSIPLTDLEVKIRT